MKKLLIFVLALCLLQGARATVYFVSTSGNSSNNGLSSGAPWDLSTFKTKISTLVIGDVVSFKRDDVFYGTFTINKPNITLNSYGTGANKPLITGLMDVTFPAQTPSNNIYVSNTNASFPASRVKYVVAGDTLAQIGRWPNRNAARKGYLNIDSKTGSPNAAGTMTSTGIPSPTAGVDDFTGAELVYRNEKWTIYNADITAHSGQTFSYVAGNGTPKVDYGWFVQNSKLPIVLDQDGEWYYEVSSKKLYMYSSTLPTGIQITTQQKGIIGTSAATGLVIDGIDVEGYMEDGISLLNSDNCIVKNCKARFCGDDGICALGNAGTDMILNPTFQKDTAMWTGLCGLTFGANVDYGLIEDCVVWNNDVKEGMGTQGNGEDFNHFGEGSAGIGGSRRSTVRRCKVYNCGYAGIRIPMSNGLIEYNYVYNTQTTREDAGAIYNQAIVKDSTYNGTVIRYNVINKSGYGSIDGLQNYTGTGGNGISSAHGIYLDDNMNGINIYGNSVYDVRGGSFYGHNIWNVELYNNNFYHNGNNGAVKITKDAGTTIATRSLNFHNNNFIVINSNFVYNWSSSDNDFGSWGTFNNNVISRPHYEPDVTGTVNDVDRIATVKGIHYTLASWKTSGFGYDLNSTKYLGGTVPSTSYYNYYENEGPGAASIPVTKTFKTLQGQANTTGQINFLTTGATLLIETPGVPLDNTTNPIYKIKQPKRYKIL